MNLAAFNTAPIADLEPQVKACVSIPAFAHAVLNQRPYQSREDLLEVARINTITWSPEEVAVALKSADSLCLELREQLAEKSLARLMSLVSA